MKFQPTDPLERFRAHYTVNDAGCWIWNRRLYENGYGYIGVRNGGKWRHVRAHRFSYETFVGPVGDLFVCHRCDVPACVNPAHLFLGTHADNMADAARKGRAAVGERSGRRRKLWKEDVLAIRAELAASNGKPGVKAALARRFGISGYMVGAIERRDCWKSV